MNPGIPIRILRMVVPLLLAAGGALAADVPALTEAMPKRAANAATDKVALLISPAVHKELLSEIQQYKVDVEARIPVQLHVVDGAWRKPAEVRATIKSLHAKEGIAGVILVGALPMHHNFGDPAEGVVKQLKVDYTFDGREQSITVDENQTLKIKR